MNRKSKEIMIMFLSVIIFSLFALPVFAVTPTGEMVTSDLWIAAVINTEEKGPVEAVWQKGGEATTSRGDSVIWGHFYASLSDVSWGSSNNPDLYVKIWFDVSGRVDVNYFHVSVPDIEVYSEYEGTIDEQGTTTTSRRYIRHYYENSQSNSSEQNEDGIQAGDYSPTGTLLANKTINDLSIGAMINTVEKGLVDAVWRLGGQATTSRGDQVVWGHFYTSPNDVSWGSEDNPDLFVKIWFDVGGRIDVNFFHVSVPDIEVYSNFGFTSNWNQSGTTMSADRYILHEYWPGSLVCNSNNLELCTTSTDCVGVGGNWYNNFCISTTDTASIFTIPKSDILIDGVFEDWNTIFPYEVGPTNDCFYLQGSDEMGWEVIYLNSCEGPGLEHIVDIYKTYIAINEEFIFFRVEFANNLNFSIEDPFFDEDDGTAVTFSFSDESAQEGDGTQQNWVFSNWGSGRVAVYYCAEFSNCNTIDLTPLVNYKPTDSFSASSGNNVEFKVKLSDIPAFDPNEKYLSVISHDCNEAAQIDGSCIYDGARECFLLNN